MGCERRGLNVAYLMCCACVLLLFSGVASAAANFSQLDSTLLTIVSGLQGAGIAVVTVAIIWAGYKMIFQHARWTDVATVVLGAVLIGAATTIANWLIPSMG
jgi:type IV secretion system protein VirB2